MDDVTPGHDRIAVAAREFGVSPTALAMIVLTYDKTLMGDPLAVERGLAAVLASIDAR